MKKWVYYNENDKSIVSWIKSLIKLGLVADGEVDDRDIREVSQEDLKGFIRCHFFAGILGWELALKQAGWPDDREIWTGSCPCFPADTLVHTKDGLIPIQDVAVGMEVLTHKKRWRKVLRTGSDLSKATVIVKGQGHYGLECTPNHPFLTSDNEWIAAEKLAYRRWINICEQPYIPIPVPCKEKKGWTVRNGRYRVSGWVGEKCVYLGTCSSEEEAARIREDVLAAGIVKVRGADAVDVTADTFAYFLGRWIGDGWVTKNNIVLCDSFDKEEEIKNTMVAAGMRVSVSRERTNIKARCGSQWLAKYLTEHFGKYSYGKKLPAWLLCASLDYIKQFVQGWKESDGNLYKGCWTINTVSKQLAIGLKFLLLRLGYAPSMKLTRSKSQCIEGRSVQARDYISVSWYESSRSFKWISFGGAGLVRKVLPGRLTTVYNLEVDEDNSYVADGIIVHNCQPFSSAGMRQGVNDERHLWPEFYRLIRATRPITVIGEQVASKDARAWWDIVCNDLEKAGYSTGAINTCACSVGAPHIRQRLYWVAHTTGEQTDKKQQRPSTNEREWGTDCTTGCCAFGGVAHSGSVRYGGRSEGGEDRNGQSVQAEGLCVPCELDNTNEQGLERQSESDRGAQGWQEQAGCHVNTGDESGRLENSTIKRWGLREKRERIGEERDSQLQRLAYADETSGYASPTNGFWRNPDWLWCRDKKWRPIKPGSIPLVDGLPKGMGHCRDCRAIRQRLKGYGNAIVIPQAVEFIKCVMEVIDAGT